MAAIKFLESLPGYKAENTFFSALDPTSTGTATATDISYVNPETAAKIVFHGSFVVVGVVVVSGTATGFDLFANQTDFVHGTGYSIASVNLLAAIAAAQTFDIEPLFNLIYADTVQTGTALADDMLGYGGILLGRGGNDTLGGSGGVLTMRGGQGEDSLYGGNGDQSLYGGEGNDSIFTGAGPALAKGGKGDDELRVSNLTPSAGPVTLYGNKGNDILYGDSIATLMHGGQGNDFFAFQGTDGIDVIADFNPRHDTIGLRIGAFTDITVGAFTDAEFIVGTAATTPDQRIIYNNQTGQVFFDQDGSGGVYAPVHFATLSNLPNLHAGNIVGFFTF